MLIVCLVSFLFSLLPLPGSEGVVVITRHAPELNDGTIIGGVKQLLPENLFLSSGAVVTEKLFLPGTPALEVKGSAAKPPLTMENGNPTPSNYRVILNGNVRLGGLAMRSDSFSLPSFSFLNSGNTPASSSDWKSFAGSIESRNLMELPPGSYGAVVLRGKKRLLLGKANETSRYAFTQLAMSGGSEITYQGDVHLEVSQGILLEGGSTMVPNDGSDLLQISTSGNFKMGAGSILKGRLMAPETDVQIRGNSIFEGFVVCDRLRVDGKGILKGIPNQAPLIHGLPESTTINYGSEVEFFTTLQEDGLPWNSALTLRWSKFSGPGEVRFSNPSGPGTKAGFSSSGIYRLQFLADDLLTRTQQLASVIVNQPPSLTTPPVLLSHANLATLVALVSDDGLPAGVTNILWSKIAGEGAVQLLAPHDLICPAIFNQPGPYRLRCVVDDSFASVTNDLEVIVNRPLEVRAGDDLLVNLPENTVRLQGEVSVDGGPVPGGLQIAWSKLSGPGAVLFENENSSETRATFSVSGKFVLRLSASDGVTVAVDDLVVVINQFPAVNAGPDQTIRLPEAVQLHGGAADDGFPEGAALALGWSKITGPGSVSFSDPQSAATTAGFSQPGEYLLALTAGDSAASNSDQIKIIVLPANEPPVVNAGLDQVVPLSQALELKGEVSDDGLPQGGQLAVNWKQLEGPGEVNFGSLTSLTTIVRFSQTGTYRLQLEASDSMDSGHDEITVVVHAPPSIAFSSTEVITSSNSLPLNASVSDDGVPGALNTTWSKVGGPGPVFFTETNRASTHARFLVPGRYELRLTATDSQSSVSSNLHVTLLAPGTNQPPAVRALVVHSLAYTNQLILSADISDDSSTVSVRWEMVEGPAPVQFGSPFTAETAALFSQSGDYLLRVIANDGHFSVSDEFNLSIFLTNQPPVVDAGPDQVLSFPSRIIELIPPPPYTPPVTFPDNLGTNFWLVFPGNFEPHVPGLKLFITAQKNAEVTVSLPGLAFITNITVLEGAMSTVEIPAAAQVLTHDIIETKGIHVEGTEELTVYGFSQIAGTSAMFLGLPTDVLGTNYLVLAYRDNLIAGSQFTVVATEDATSVTIIPTVTTIARMVPGYRNAGVPINLILNRGQTYRYRLSEGGTNDVTGSKVFSDKRVAVFAGHRCASIPTQLPCDMIVEQLFSGRILI